MQQAISYRDRHGFVTVTTDEVCRYVNYSYSDIYDHLMQSGLYGLLVEKGYLVQHEECTVDERNKTGYYRVLIPEKIPFISYPSEWCADQWRTVLQTFLEINNLAIEHGMILKDATPYNFTFYNGRCLFFDTLSFSKYENGQPWLAYRQFCESMLGPFALMCFNDPDWARLLNTSTEGWSLSFISKNLSFKSWFNMTLLVHIHWHSKYSNTAVQKSFNNNTGFDKQKLTVLWNMLHRSVSMWKIRKGSGTWLSYYDEGLVSSDYINDKKLKIKKWLSALLPECMIDLGANNGLFSLMGCLYAKRVIAVELDHDCINQLFQSAREKQITNLVTILADLTQPTPGVGWENKEKESLLKRLKGDMLLAVAVIHHLCISKNVPLPLVAQLFADISTRYAIVEFVPKTDEKVRLLLQNREDVFDDYTEPAFTEAFNCYFNLLEVYECGSSGRKLFLWIKK